MTSVPLFLGLLALAGALAVGIYAFVATSARSRTAEVLASVETYYSRPEPFHAGESSAVIARSLPPLLDRLRAIVARVSSKSVTAKIQHRLDLAGDPPRWSPERVLAYKGLGLIALGILGGLIGFRHGALVLPAAALGAVAGFFLPDVLLYNAGLKRQQKLERALPDALDLLTVCVEAGLGFDAAIAQVAQKTEGPMAAECSRVLQEMQFGKSRVEALRALSERTTVTQLRTFVTALVQASELGVPVATVLREQAKDMRMRRRQRAEEQAQKVPVKILFPLIFCLFPALFVIVIGPGVISIYHSLFHH
jgi:tight adherence protein C